MVEPAHVGRAALVALAVDARLRLGVGADHRAALARRDLLVRVEARRRRGCPRAPTGLPVGVNGAERLARVLDDPEPALAGEPLERRHVGGVAEDVHGQEARRPLGHRRRGGLRVEVQRAPVDVAEDRPRLLVQHGVRRRDEAERGRDDLVARPRCPPRAARGEARRCRSRPRRRAARRAARRAPPRTRRAAGPSERWRERSTSRTSSSSRAPIAGRASGMNSSLTPCGRTARGPRGAGACRPRASPRAPPSSTRSRSRTRRSRPRCRRRRWRRAARA